MTEIDNEAVEAVARAIHQERFGGQLVWGEQPDAEQECREEARAAIAAMRTPTEAMANAAECAEPFSFETMWQAAIDEVLK